MIRTFIAIELPQQIKTALGEIQNQLRQTGADVSWTKPSNIHLTLKFLGDLDEQKVDAVREITSKSVTNAKLFDLQTNGVGFFPNPKRARVIWVGLEGDIATLIHLQETIERDLDAAGFPSEEHSFSPHLTIGRVRTAKNLNALAARSSEIAIKSIPFQVDQITIVRSQLHPAGAIYTPIEKYLLQSV